MIINIEEFNIYSTTLNHSPTVEAQEKVLILNTKTILKYRARDNLSKRRTKDAELNQNKNLIFNF